MANMTAYGEAVGGAAPMSMETTREERDRAWTPGPKSFLARVIRDVNALEEAVEAVEAVNQHRHFCEECRPARGCGQFYVLFSRAAALRAGLEASNG